jgi:hypothetical protein
VSLRSLVNQDAWTYEHTGSPGADDIPDQMERDLAPPEKRREALPLGEHMPRSFYKHAQNASSL